MFFPGKRTRIAFVILHFTEADIEKNFKMLDYLIITLIEIYWRLSTAKYSSELHSCFRGIQVHLHFTHSNSKL